MKTTVKHLVTLKLIYDVVDEPTKELKELPPELQREVEGFVNFLIEKKMKKTGK